MSLRRRLAASALAGAMAVGGLTLLPGAAGAATCTATTSSPCSLTGTASLSAGTLTLTTGSTTLSWVATLTGQAQAVVDTTAADEGFVVSDLTGTFAGWHVNVSATTFTNSGASATFPNTGTLTVNGSTSSVSSTNGPSTSCAYVLSCITPGTSTVTYPAAITTAASTPPATRIFSAPALSGVGLTQIGGSSAANPVGWWINVPATAYAGNYVSTLTMAIVSAP